MSNVIIKSRDIRVQTQTVDACKSKEVELLRDKGVVLAIRVKCTCGEWTNLELDYPSMNSKKEEQRV